MTDAATIPTRAHKGRLGWLTRQPWYRPELGRACRPVFCRPERSRYRRRRGELSVSAWCERHRVVTLSSLAGPWRNSVTPYLAGIMDGSMHPAVQEITLCKAPQTGGSEAVNNCIANRMDVSPGPVLYVYPDEITARENSQDRIGPMFASSARLSRLLTGRADDVGALKIRLSCAPIYMAWANSVARLANKPIRYLVFDETDKYKGSNVSETDPIRLGEARTTTYRWNRKVWKISSPSTEGGYIWQALLAAQMRFAYEVACPLCGHRQVMVFGERLEGSPELAPGGIRWPPDVRDPRRIETEDLAWYECAGCGAAWRDHLRDQAVRGGRWIDQATGRPMAAALDADRPRSIAFHVPSWLSPFVGLSRVAAAFLACRTPEGLVDLNAHKNFQNTHKAEPWFAWRADRREDAVLALREDRPSGLVPAGAACLLAAVDTQDNGFWYELRAFGFGLDQSTWGVRAGFVDTVAALEAVLFADEYRTADGTPVPLRAAVIDSQGHRTAEIYDLCRRHHPRLIPLRGENRRMIQPHAWTTVDCYPGTRRPIPGGVKVLRVNTGHYKDLLSPRLDVAPGDPGAWMYPAETTEDWARQMCAEYLDEKGDWQCPPNRANHAWDVSTYLLCLADLLGVRFWRRPGAAGSAGPVASAERPRELGGRW